MWDVEEDETTQAPAEEAAAAEVPAEAAAAEGAADGALTSEGPVKGFEPKKLVFKHWVRPKFLQYNYLYNYQHNYYDDVIDYLDRRNKGMVVEKPRAQTWAERVLRTYLTKVTHREAITRQSAYDRALMKHISVGARFYRYHSKSIIARKYPTLGFNTISI